MVDNPEPLWALRLHAGFEPVLIGDTKICRLKAALLEFDVAGDHQIFIDAALTGMVSLGDLHHLKMTIAELVGGEERTIGPAECDPRDGWLRLKLRQEHKLAFVGL